jgi:hypothetical protein
MVQHMMAWVARSGYFLAVAAALLLSPVGDFLPLELWAWLHGYSANTYFVVRPGENSKTPELLVLAAGVLLVVLGKTLGRKRTDDV